MSAANTDLVPSLPLKFYTVKGLQQIALQKGINYDVPREELLENLSKVATNKDKFPRFPWDHYKHQGCQAIAQHLGVPYKGVSKGNLTAALDDTIMVNDTGFETEHPHQLAIRSSDLVRWLLYVLFWAIAGCGGMVIVTWLAGLYGNAQCKEFASGIPTWTRTVFFGIMVLLVVAKGVQEFGLSRWSEVCDYLKLLVKSCQHTLPVFVDTSLRFMSTCLSSLWPFLYSNKSLSIGLVAPKGVPDTDIEEEAEQRDRQEEIKHTVNMANEIQRLNTELAQRNSSDKAKNERIADLAVQLQRSHESHAQKDQVTKELTDELQRLKTDLAHADERQKQADMQHSKSLGSYEERIKALQEDSQHQATTELANELQRLEADLAKAYECHRQAEMRHSQSLQSYETRVKALQEDNRQLTEQYFKNTKNVLVMARIRGGPRLDPPDIQSEADLSQISDYSFVYNGNSTQFVCDRTFSASDTNWDVFQKVQPLIEVALAGHDICIMAYGQSGTGKTHTMFDGEDSIAQRTFQKALDFVQETSVLGATTTISISAVEIYMDRPQDLLVRRHTGGPDYLMVKAGGEIEGLTQKVVESQEDFRVQLHQACDNRRTESTYRNHRSSRSHMVFKIHIAGNRKKSDVLLVDLAGNESLSDGEGKLFQDEMIYINKSLSSISELLTNPTAEFSAFMPNSLSRILKPCICSSKTLLFAHLSPNLTDVQKNHYTMKVIDNITRARLPSKHLKKKNNRD